MSADISQTAILTADDHLVARKGIAARLRFPHSPLFRPVLTVLVALCICQCSGAEIALPAGQRIIHEIWTFKDGAPDVARAFAQTADGYLWVGAPAGLFRFDGTRFELFRSPFGDQLQSTNVSSLFAPDTGGLWAGYVFGGFSFLKNGRVANFVESTGSVVGFAQDRHGIVWAAAVSGLWRFDGSSWQHIGADWNAPRKPFPQVGFDREGILWVLAGTRDFQVAKQLYFLLPGDRRFRKAGDNILVLGFTWDPDHNVLTTHERPRQPGSGIELEGSLPAYPILRKNSDQILDRANNIWFFSINSSVLRHPAGEPLADIVSTVSPSNSEAYEINTNLLSRLVDREGSIWIGGDTGLHRFSYSPLIEQELPKRPGPFFTLAADEGGVVWISAGDSNGSSTLYRVADGKVISQRSQGGMSNFGYGAPDKTFWFGGEGGLWHMANGSLTRIGLPQEVSGRARDLVTITQDRAGGMWVSFGPVGLYRLKDGVWTKYGGRRDLPTSGVVIEFTDTLGRVWFGYTKNQLAVLDGDRVQTFGPKNGVQVGNVTAIYGSGAEIWIGGEFGLEQFDHGRFRTIHSVDMESLRGISGIVETANGDLWLNGLGGIVHVRRGEILEALKNPAYQVSGERFDRRAGLPGLPSQIRKMPTAIEGTDGRLWFTVNNGVVWLDPARASNKMPPPSVTIQSVSADDRGYALEQPLRFPASTSNVQISYAAVSLLNPEAIHFRYKLRETDKDWHEAATSNSVNYRNLPPGSYHFVVTASDTNGLWSDNTTTAEFTVLPAFYQTNWFRALCAAGVLALLWAAYQFRIRQLQREFNARVEERVAERARVARDLHDTLLQSFQGLIPVFQTARNLLPGQSDRAAKVLDEGLHDAADAIVEGRNAIQNLRAIPSLDPDLGSLLNAAGEELAQSAEPDGSAPAFRVVVEGSRRPLVPLLRDEIYRIGREVLRNAFRHAHAGRIEAEIRYDRDMFRLRIRDDGKGIDSSVLKEGARTGHFGLPGMHERAQKMGARLKIWSEPGAGTEAELTVPARIAYEKFSRSNGWWTRLGRRLRPTAPNREA